jgi:hypothetical protein
MTSKVEKITIAGILAVTLFILFPLFPVPPRANRTVAKLDLARLKAAMDYYRGDFGAYPTGSNADIVRALTSRNSRLQVIMEVAPESLNERGEYIDPWNSPYVILVTTQELTLYSHGPDSQQGMTTSMWNRMTALPNMRFHLTANQLRRRGDRPKTTLPPRLPLKHNDHTRR